MVFEKEGNTTLVSDESRSLSLFLENLNENYESIKDDNIIVSLIAMSSLTSDDIMKFLMISNTHRALNKSFVLVTDKLAFDDVPHELCVVPSIQEARDIIEMEEIERDLGI